MTSTVHRALRWPRLAVAAVVAGSGIAGAAAPAAAAACSGTSGVTVVVDYGGSESIRCASGDPTSGFDALARAGFSVTRVQQFPSAVCRINGYPASDPCVQMPPSNAYWSYWHAKRGGTWSYYSVGPASSNPAPGTVEGWAFGAGAPPSVAPPAPTATPSSSSSTSSKPRSTSSSSPKPSAGSSPRPSTTSGTSAKKPSKSPSAVPSPTTATTPAATAATTSPTAGTTGAMSPLAARTDGGSGRGGLLAGLGLIAALAGAASVVVWRRRHT
ncbi:MAG TPA: hypothetical protein VFJ22_19700 [Dermatophilaceae bacterium]|nr:hypothetical protein [Dermatophilaceae bacterium]